MKKIKYSSCLKNIPRGVKASVALSMANIVTAGIQYITTPIYTRLLSSAEYGQVSVFLSWIQIMGIMAMFCLSYGVFNNGMVDYPDKRDEYSFSMLILSNLITAIVFGTFICLYPVLRPWIGLSWPLVLLMGPIFLLQPAYNFWTKRQRYELKYKMTTIWTVTSAILSPLTAIVCILIFNNNRLYARIFGAEGALLLIYSAFYICLGSKNKWKLNTKYWKAAVLFNLPLIPHYLSSYLLNSMDRLMISKMVNDSATAYYSVAYSVASVATIVWTAINSSLIPYTYEKCKEKKYQAISNVTLPILCFFAVVCAFVILLAPEVVAVMATKDYRGAIYVIPPVVGGVFFQVQYYIYANVLYYYKRPKYVMFASVTGAVLNLFLNYLFIKRYGYIAAGYTTLVCYFVQAVFDYFALKHVVGESIYNMRPMGLLSLVVIIIALFSNLLYFYEIIRYIMAISFIVIGILFRKQIISYVFSIRKQI